MTTERPGSVHRTLEILEVVAARGGASAKEIADATGLPLPSVYRLLRELLDSDYLVHIREEKRFELGYKLHQLGVSLHQQIGVPREVRAEVTALHHQLGAAAYLAVHRGSQIAVVCTADSPQCPRLRPLEFGFHEAAHAGREFLGAQERRVLVHRVCAAVIEVRLVVVQEAVHVHEPGRSVVLFDLREAVARADREADGAVVHGAHDFGLLAAANTLRSSIRQKARPTAVP